MTRIIIQNAKPQKYVFANKDRSIVVVTDINSIVEVGTPIEPESGEDLEYVGIVSPKTECRTYYDNGCEILTGEQK